MRKVVSITKKADVIHPRQVSEVSFSLAALIFLIGLAFGILIGHV